MSKKLSVAVVGAGYFGRFHCEKMHSLPNVDLVAVVDTNPDRAQQVASQFSCKPYADHRHLFDQGVNAAVISVPSNSHFPVACDLLQAGFDLLVEKPLATSEAQAHTLCQLAKKRALCLQVGHLERFNPILQEALRQFRHPRLVHMTRQGPFPGRGNNIDVVFELMTHDLDILLQLDQSPIESIAAQGYCLLTDNIDYATCTLRFASGLEAHLSASRVSSENSRAFRVLDDHALWEIDLAKRSLTKNSFDGSEHKIDHVSLGAGDPLLDQDRSFVDVLQNGRKPLVSGPIGWKVVSLAQQIKESIRKA